MDGNHSTRGRPAAFHLETGDYIQAESLYRRCLEIRKRVLGEDHPETLASAENLARTLRKTGKLDEAAQLARAALEKRERMLGLKHSDTSGNMAALADILRDSGDLDGAALLYEQALEGLRESPGSSHPSTLRVLYEYSVLRKIQRRSIEARRLAYELMTGARKTLPPGHPDRSEYEQLFESLR